MCNANPAYASNLNLFSSWLSHSKLQNHAQICDVGAGTGNYILAASSILPDAHYVHLDRDPVMNLHAGRKYRRAGLKNIDFQSTSIDEVELSMCSQDLVICVNSLYTFKHPSYALRKIFNWLKPGGFLFSIDLGRQMNVSDWSKYIVASSLREGGVIPTVRRFYKGRHAIAQNREIRRQQDSGHFWLHNTRSFVESLRSAGLSIVESGTCYRNSCDFAIGQKD
jgi:ubiquinone/menaquinone biosynthesis C-methylase UbiE